MKDMILERSRVLRIFVCLCIFSVSSKVLVDCRVGWEMTC